MTCRQRIIECYYYYYINPQYLFGIFLDEFGSISTHSLSSGDIRSNSIRGEGVS